MQIRKTFEVVATILACSYVIYCLHNAYNLPHSINKNFSRQRIVDKMNNFNHRTYEPLRINHVQCPYSEKAYPLHISGWDYKVSCAIAANTSIIIGKYTCVEIEMIINNRNEKENYINELHHLQVKSGIDFLAATNFSIKGDNHLIINYCNDKLNPDSFSLISIGWYMLKDSNIDFNQIKLVKIQWG